MEVPPFLISVFKIIEKSFGSEINQHEYEGLIVFLYDYMSNRNIGKLLSYFSDKQEEIITAEVDRYYNYDKLKYDDIKNTLDKNGFILWTSAFYFQVSKSFVENEILYVEGRFIEGEIIQVGDEIRTIRVDDAIELVNMKVISIEIYKKQVEFMSLGMTGRLGIKGYESYRFMDNSILSNEPME